MKTFSHLLLIACFFISPGITAQKADKPVTISGNVVDANHDPVEGATICIDNIETTYRTMRNGTYKIKASPSAYSIEIRSNGFDPSKELINKRNSIDFVLKESSDNSGLNTANQSNADSVAKNSGSKQKGRRMNSYNDIYQMIRAEVPGVVVNGRSIVIQQGHSFFGSSTPLFVINGVIVTSIDNVNPLEVKSIKVLKGSAAAIYGQQGTNGVITITLKNGTEQEK